MKYLKCLFFIMQVTYKMRSLYNFYENKYYCKININKTKTYIFSTYRLGCVGWSIVW